MDKFHVNLFCNKKETPKRLFMNFGLQGGSYTPRMAYAAIAKTLSFAFDFVCFLRLLLTCCPRCYFLPCRNHAPPTKHTGIQFISESLKLSLDLSATSLSNMLRWRRGDSNPRPRLISRCIFPYGLYSNKYIYTLRPFKCQRSEFKNFLTLYSTFNFHCSHNKYLQLYFSFI